MKNVLGAAFRRVEDREHLGKPALVAIATRSYDTTVEDPEQARAKAERTIAFYTAG